MTDSIIPDSSLASLPVLALRNSVLFPASVVPVNVGRPRSVRLIEEAFGMDRPTIGVLAQHDAEDEDPGFTLLHEVGTLARVLKVIRLSSGHYSVVLQGIGRMRILEPLQREPCLRARVERLVDTGVDGPDVEPLSVCLRETARELLQGLPQPPREVQVALDNIQDPGALADLVASHLPIDTNRKQDILATLDLTKRLEMVLDLLRRQTEVHRVKNEVASMVREEMSSSQRELLLRQQLRSIRRELGETGDEDDELDELRERLARVEPSEEARKEAKRELGRMGIMNPSSAEYQVALSYVEWITELPWNRVSADRLDVAEARRVLDEDHHGLEAPKKRILEYIAVRKLQKKKPRSPLLCFLGPPGVGKTSLGKSIARATGRKFVRISLGGVQDEAEIRGHRRTYVGAMPGRLISALKKAGTANPVIVLDEIDKMSSDAGGDPGSALLEALDGEQNSAFVDHYINAGVDLSKVLFVATANRRDTIPRALLDRMEVIELPGYTIYEKHLIARDFLVPHQLSDHGLSPEHLEITDDALRRLISEYTHEAGVRQLSQEVAAICRAVAVKVAGGDRSHVDADAAYVQKVLGPPKRQVQRAETIARAGVVPTLTWTPAGGELLQVESTRMPGKGVVHLTGKMGDVLKESAAAAISYIRARAVQLKVDPKVLEHSDVHVHLPQGAIPKDGPALGLPILISALSALLDVKVRPDVAVTGEITLRGKILRVSGLKQKCLAAHQAGLAHVLIPRANEYELEEIPQRVRDELQIHLISRVDEALAFVLDDLPAETAA